MSGKEINAHDRAIIMKFQDGGDKRRVLKLPVGMKEKKRSYRKEQCIREESKSL